MAVVEWAMISSAKRFFDLRCAASLAFAATVALGYLSALWDRAIDPFSRVGITCLVLGAIYALAGTIDYPYFKGRVSGPWRAIYLGFQGIVLFGIFLTSRLSSQMSLCAYPLVAAMVTLLGPAAATLGVVLVYVMILAVEGFYYGSDALVRWSISMLPAFGFVVIFTRIALREKAARAHAESLSAEVEKLAVIQERNRLAREIHDGLGHFLTTIHVQLEAARTIHSTDPSRALEAVAKAQVLARDALIEVRRSVGAIQADVRPAPLAGRLRDLASTTDGWGAAVSLETLGEVRDLATDTEHTLFRTVQEGLTNVRKHACARTAVVTLDYRDPGRVFVRVTDDGRGVVNANSGHGLAGLRERISALGGRVVVENPPGGGFRLQAEIPA